MLIKCANTLNSNLYHVGMIIYTSSSIWNPNIEIGPTWVKIEGKFLLGATTGGSTGTGINSNASVDLNGSGGEASHVITTEEMASHDHGSAGNDGWADFRLCNGGGNLLIARGGTGTGRTNGTTASYSTIGLAGASTSTSRLLINSVHTHSAVGSNWAHNNMPPFRAVYIWEKTA